MHPVYIDIVRSLSGFYPEPEAKALAKSILTEVFRFSALDLYDGKDREFSEKEHAALEDILSRLKRFEPFQYITGEASFCGLPFHVAPGVLIPRPETAELVDWIVSDFQGKAEVSIVDIGTGSGCIAVALARFLPGARVSAWDISDAALGIARSNAERNRVRVDFRQVDVFSHIPAEAHAHIFVSNPPYIREREKADMERNVLDWEPELALFVPDGDPLRYYRRIAGLGLVHLAPSGVLYVEINQAYGAETVELLAGMGYRDIVLRKDMSGNDRMIKAVRP